MGKSSDVFIGVDLGGTNITAGVMNDKDKLIARVKNKTKATDGAEAVFSRIVKTIREAIEQSRVSVGDVGGIGIGAPGLVDLQTQVVSQAPNLCWDEFPLGARLAQEFKTAITVDNDVNVGAWGEHMLGASAGYDDSLSVFVGTGIGGGLIFDGELYHGVNMTAGEIGHTIVEAGAGLGRRTLENLASRTAIVNTIKALILANKPSKMSKIVGGDLDNIRSKALAQALDEKDELTVQVVSDAARYVGIAVANMATVLSLPCVVLGGGVTEALGKPYVSWVRQAFTDHVHPRSLSCEIVASQLGDDAGLYGAAFLARQRLMDA